MSVIHSDTVSSTLMNFNFCCSRVTLQEQHEWSLYHIHIRVCLSLNLMPELIRFSSCIVLPYWQILSDWVKTKVQKSTFPAVICSQDQRMACRFLIFHIRMSIPWSLPHHLQRLSSLKTFWFTEKIKHWLRP